jgi:Flp pilus assembly protein TadD
MGGLRERQAASELVTQANRLLGEGKHAHALDLLRKAVAKDPKFCTAQNNLAWRLLTGPMDQRDAKAALVHARAAVQHCGEGAHYNTLGLALLRNGEVEEAMAQFDESLCRSSGRDDGRDYFLLAVCYRKIGDAAKAVECLRLGDRWLAANRHRLSPGLIQELEAFQAEAKVK